jgi:type I site-specific restriction endonuclease
LRCVRWTPTPARHDYMLFIGGKTRGIVEAKREGAGLGGVAEQSARYATSYVKQIERWLPEDQPLPFLYESGDITVPVDHNIRPHHYGKEANYCLGMG